MTGDRSPATPQSVGGSGVTRFATRGEHRLSYESSGDEAGIPVLALHDLLADRGQLRPLTERAHALPIRLTLLDARGHGASPMISGRAYPPSALAADALAVLDAEGLPRIHLAAIGWAAATALAIAATAPGRVASLVLAAPYLPALVADRSDALARQVGSVHVEMLQEAADLAEKGQTDRALDLYLGARIGADWRDRFPKPRLGAIRRAAPNLAPLLAGTFAAPIDQDALERLDIPTVLLVKDEADVLERGTAETLASLIPHARITRLGSRSHDMLASNLEWTEAIAEALLGA